MFSSGQKRVCCARASHFSKPFLPLKTALAFLSIGATKGFYMLNKYLVVISITVLLLSNIVKAENDLIPENNFKKILKCMESVPLDAEKYKGIGSQQVVLLSVLEHITHKKASIKGLNIDYSEIYDLVQSNCPKELEILKKLSVQKEG